MDPAHDHAAEYAALKADLEALRLKATVTQLAVAQEGYLDTRNDIGDLAALLQRIRMALGIVETLQLRLDRRIANLAQGKESGT